jgi:hypothetical protein
VCLSSAAGHRPAVILIESVVALRDDQAGGEAFDVPLSRPGKGLVEVVEVERERPLRGSKGVRSARGVHSAWLDLGTSYRLAGFRR